MAFMKVYVFDSIDKKEIAMEVKSQSGKFNVNYLLRKQIITRADPYEVVRKEYSAVFLLLVLYASAADKKEDSINELLENGHALIEDIPVMLLNFRDFRLGRFKAWANWARAHGLGLNEGLVSLDSALVKACDLNNFNRQIIFPVVFSEELGISYYMPIGNSGKTVLLYDDRRPYMEITTRVKQDMSSSWRQALEVNLHGAALLWTSRRRVVTTLARLRSVHTRNQRHVESLKVYPPCPNFNVTQAAPAHILACIGCHKSQMLSNPATVLHCLKTHGFMDLI
ncbi:hypothetical protein TNCV_1228121 [Trichonephila clavipes]|nr:hypothetical protein TNCV_1228121 [Trichonephila clavipes]